MQHAVQISETLLACVNFYGVASFIIFYSTGNREVDATLPQDTSMTQVEVKSM